MSHVAQPPVRRKRPKEDPKAAIRRQQETEAMARRFAMACQSGNQAHIRALAEEAAEVFGPQRSPDGDVLQTPIGEIGMDQRTLEFLNREFQCTTLDDVLQLNKELVTSRDNFAELMWSGMLAKITLFLLNRTLRLEKERQELLQLQTT